MPTINLRNVRLLYTPGSGRPSYPFNFDVSLISTPVEEPPEEPESGPAPSAVWQEEIDEVDTSVTLTWQIDETYSNLEYSVEAAEYGYHIRGGHVEAQNKGAQTLLYELGYRFYGREIYHSNFVYRPPAPLSRVVSVAKTTHWMESLSIFPAYGDSWWLTPDGTNERPVFEAADDRWRFLNGAGASTAGFPSGHRWSSIVFNNFWYFDQDATHKGYLHNPTGTSQRHIRISYFSNDEAVYDEIVTLFASQALKDGFNSMDRTSMDGGDGDPNDSDEFYTFLNDVIAKIKEGTPEIVYTGPSQTITPPNGNPITVTTGQVMHPARAGKADFKVGTYAYAGHRRAPSFAIPDVYVNIALAFNDAGIGYPALVAEHAAQAWRVGTREYIDIQVWDQSSPFGGRKARGYLDNYRDVYDTYFTTAESQPNNMVMLPVHYWWFQKFRTGTLDEMAEIEEMVEKIFSNDPAVLELYTYWTDPENFYNAFTLRHSVDIIDEMEDNWYKAYFQKYAMWMQWERSYPEDDSVLLADGVSTMGHDTYIGLYNAYTGNGGASETPPPEILGYNPNSEHLAHLERHFATIYKYRRDDSVHAYALLRQISNSTPPKILSMNRRNTFDKVAQATWTTAPPWRLGKSDYHPDVAAGSDTPEITSTEYDAVMDTLRAETAQDTYISSDDLVIANVPGYTQDPTLICRAFWVLESQAELCVHGPATVKVARAGEEVETREYGEGLHYFYEYGPKFTGVYVYLDTDPATTDARLYANSFFGTRLEKVSYDSLTALIPGADFWPTHKTWMYFHKSKSALGYNLTAGSRFRVVHPGGTTDIGGDPSVADAFDPGHHQADLSNSRGPIYPVNINPWISGDRTRQLMPRELALREGFTIHYSP
jgi:hypothetical protein